MAEIKDLLAEKLKEDIQNLSKLDAGTEAKAKAIDGIATLYRLRIDEMKAETDRIERWDQRESDRAHKDEQRKDQKLDRWLNVGVQVGLALISCIAYDIWHRRGLRFEETGTISSPMTRNLVSKMTPKR